MWEYEIIEAKNHNELIDAASELGKGCWEMINVERVHGHVIGYFKRPAGTGKK